jgi:hypothetical protein
MLKTYEEQLSSDMEWALSEGSRHFDQKSTVHSALREITQRLDSLQVPYAVVGGMALFLHGFMQFTDDVALLVTAGSLKTIHEELIGLGYVPLFEGSKNIRDTARGVRIEFLVTGGFPGDGKPKPVVFPDPSKSFIEVGGIRCLKLEKLIELKLASALSNPGRIRDFGDVQDLIRLLGLETEFAEQLDPSVKGKFLELWQGVKQDPSR